MLERIKKYKSVGIDTLLYLLSSLIPMLLLVAINPLLAKNLSPEDYAIIGYVSSFSGIMTPLISFFVMRYYLKSYFKVSQEEREVIKSAILQTLLLFCFCMAVIVGISITIYHYHFNSSSTLPLMPYLAINISSLWMGLLFTFNLSEYRIDRKSKDYLNYSIVNGIIRVGILLLLVVWLGYGALGYESAISITCCISFLYSIVKYRKYIFTKISYHRCYEIIKFCWPLAIAGCLEFFSNGYGRVLLERIGNNTEYGYYSVGNQFASYINVFTLALYTTFNPDMYECVANNNTRKLLKIGGILLGTELVVVSVFVLLAPFIVELLTASRYTCSASYAQIISISQIFVILFYYINDVTIAYGYTKIILSTKIVASIISFLFMTYLVSSYEYNGAAYGQIVNYCSFSLVSIAFLYYKIKKR